MYIKTQVIRGACLSGKGIGKALMSKVAQVSKTSIHYLTVTVKEWKCTIDAEPFSLIYKGSLLLLHCYKGACISLWKSPSPHVCLPASLRCLVARHGCWLHPAQLHRPGLEQIFSGLLPQPGLLWCHHRHGLPLYALWGRGAGAPGPTISQHWGWPLQLYEVNPHRAGIAQHSVAPFQNLTMTIVKPHS